MCPAQNAYGLVIDTLTAMVGQECWGVACGEGAGSIIQLSIGKKVRRTKPVPNPHLNEDQRNYNSEYSLMIWCPWRLQTEVAVLCGSNDPNDNDGVMVRATKDLQGLSIVRANAERPSLDLHIEFHDGRKLFVFCVNSQHQEEKEYDYVLFGPNLALSVGPGGKVVSERR